MRIIAPISGGQRCDAVDAIPGPRDDSRGCNRLRRSRTRRLHLLQARSPIEVGRICSLTAVVVSKTEQAAHRCRSIRCRCLAGVDAAIVLPGGRRMQPVH